MDFSTFCVIPCFFSHSQSSPYCTELQTVFVNLKGIPTPTKQLLQLASAIRGMSPCTQACEHLPSSCDRLMLWVHMHLPSPTWWTISFKLWSKMNPCFLSVLLVGCFVPRARTVIGTQPLPILPSLATDTCRSVFYPHSELSEALCIMQMCNMWCFMTNFFQWASFSGAFIL